MLLKAVVDVGVQHPALPKNFAQPHHGDNCIAHPTPESAGSHSCTAETDARTAAPAHSTRRACVARSPTLGMRSRR